VKALRMDIEYPKRYFAAQANGDGDVNPEQVTLNVIVSAVSLCYGQGKKQMGIRDLRMWSKIQNEIMDDDGLPRAGELHLSDEQFDFLYARVTEAEYPPSFAGPVSVFADYLDTVKLAKAEPPQRGLE